MNSEENSEMALRYCCAIGSIGWNMPDNKLERPAYLQPNSALFHRDSGRRRSNSETALRYSCAITPMPLGLQVPGSEFLVEEE